MPTRSNTPVDPGAASDSSPTPQTEAQLIQRWFDGPAWRALAADPAIKLRNGDDASVVAGPRLVLSVDSAVSGRHFPEAAPGDGVATRALGAALSDLAAMGSLPVGFLLALHLPSLDAAWLSAFSDGLLGCARRHRAPLLGGDTVRGPLAVVVHVVGRPVHRDGLRRDGASAGDAIYVSGPLGGGGGGLAALSAGADDAELLRRYWQPAPRLALGAALADIASAAIDLSDGLEIDLGRLAAASGLGAELSLDQVPLLGAAARRFGRERTLAWALGGGDDYELCFTVPQRQSDAFAARAAAWPDAWPECVCIGRMVVGSALRWRRDDGSWTERAGAGRGYDHFRQDDGPCTAA